MFRCDRCRTQFTNSEARGLEYCPLCQEHGEQSPLFLKLFASDTSLPGAVERTRRVVRELGGRPEKKKLGSVTRISLPLRLQAPRGRSTDISAGKAASS